MLFPSKVISYNESILPKLPLVLRFLEQGPQTISDVYKFMKGYQTFIMLIPLQSLPLSAPAVLRS